MEYQTTDTDTIVAITTRLRAPDGCAGIVVAKILATEIADRGFVTVVATPSQKAEVLDLAWLF